MDPLSPREKQDLMRLAREKAKAENRPFAEVLAELSEALGGRRPSRASGVVAGIGGILRALWRDFTSNPFIAVAGWFYGIGFYLVRGFLYFLTWLATWRGKQAHGRRTSRLRRNDGVVGSPSSPAPSPPRHPCEGRDPPPDIAHPPRWRDHRDMGSCLRRNDRVSVTQERRGRGRGRSGGY